MRGAARQEGGLTGTKGKEIIFSGWVLGSGELKTCDDAGQKRVRKELNSDRARGRRPVIKKSGGGAGPPEPNLNCVGDRKRRKKGS